MKSPGILWIPVKLFVSVLKGQPANSGYDEQHFKGICYMELLMKLILVFAYHFDCLEKQFSV